MQPYMLWVWLRSNDLGGKDSIYLIRYLTVVFLNILDLRMVESVDIEPKVWTTKHILL